MMGAFHVEALTPGPRGPGRSWSTTSFAEKAEEVAAAVGARVVADPIAAINDPEVDAVLIATPGAAHEEQVNACLDAGMPVLCEKPLTTDVASAYAIVQKEATLGRPLIQVGFMRRFDPEYVALKDLITSGGLGNPLIVHCTHRNPAVPDFFDSEYMMRDSVVHEVDVARFLLDEEITQRPGPPGAATSAAPAGTNDPMLVVFETESGRLVTDEIYVRSGVAYEVRTEVVGEQGSAMIGLDQNLQVEDRPTAAGAGGSPPASSSASARRTTSSCSGGWTPRARGTIDGPGAWDGYAAVAVCEAGVQAAPHRAEGRVVLQPRPTVEPAPGITAPDLEAARP